MSGCLRRRVRIVRSRRPPVVGSRSRRRIDRSLDVGFRDGRVAAVEPDLPVEDARQVVEAAGRLVVPGLIDLHTHVYWGGTSLGVDADALARRSGTTTFVDAGSAGPGNFPGFRRHVIERSRAGSWPISTSPSPGSSASRAT